MTRMTWEEIESHAKDGKTLLWDGVENVFLLDNVQIFPHEARWPDHLVFEPYEVDTREVFGVLKLTFPVEACQGTSKQ